MCQPVVVTSAAMKAVAEDAGLDGLGRERRGVGCERRCAPGAGAQRRGDDDGERDRDRDRGAPYTCLGDHGRTIPEIRQPVRTAPVPRT